MKHEPRNIRVNREFLFMVQFTTDSILFGGALLSHL